MAIETNCPNCSSNSTQSVMMLIKTGTTTRKTRGMAAGATRRRMGGAAYGSTSTTKSSLVAQYSSFPPRPVGALPGLLFLVSIGLWVGIFTIPLGWMLWRKAKRMLVPLKESQYEWDLAMIRRSKLWICKKCGNEWVPEEA